MERHIRRNLALLALAALSGGPAWGQAAPQPVATPQSQTRPAATEPTAQEIAILQALVANPVTAPYRFVTAIRNRRIILAGRVGTKEIHDIAIRTALAVTASIDDRVSIDTAEAHRVAGIPAATLPTSGFGMPYGPLAGTGYGNYPYVYPQPLFGRYDDPFQWFQPPAISYPPFWGGLTNLRRAELGMGMPATAGPGMPPQGPGIQGPYPAETPPSPTPATPSTTSAPGGSSSAPGRTIEMSLDPRGVAVLRGTVDTMADRVAVGQKVAQLNGVSEVINLLAVADEAANGPATTVQVGGAVPPAPPRPADDLNAPPLALIPPGDAGAPAGGGDPIDRRLAQALAKRPALAGVGVKSSVVDGVAHLSGKVPSVLEAMIAYRAAQQTPGVRSIIDNLQFTVPDEPGKNPLVDKGRPEDVEPYLEAQVRRQVGDEAHIDRVRVVGDRAEIKGTVPRADDRPRIEAILRSMPVLRGFKVQTDLQAE